MQTRRFLQLWYDFRRYMHFYKEEVDTVESYPAMVLEELHSYSSAVSRFFNVKEIYTGSQVRI